MKLPERIEAFCKLGEAVQHLGMGDRKMLAEKALNENPWFTEENVNFSLRGVETLLARDSLTQWALSYNPEPMEPKTVGVVTAGNIPLVGFHDFLCVLLAGHRLRIKLSARDSVLLKFVLEKLAVIRPDLSDRVVMDDNLKGVDALIATGSDNTARYFEYYFRKIPHVIRKNRASCAVLIGEEPDEEWSRLGMDVFSYFGLGCRNVSKLFVPEDFEFGPMIRSWEPHRRVIHHHKYGNNYDYQKAILLTNQEPFLDAEFILLQESRSLVSPIGVLYFEKYRSQHEVMEKLMPIQDKLQVVTSAKGWFAGSVPFGMAQLPRVSDYADNLDTMKFLMGLGVGG